MRRTRPAVGIFVMSLVLFTASMAVAEEPAASRGERTRVADLRAEYRPPAWPEAPNTGAMLLRLAIGTFVALGTCAGSLWFGRRWLRGNVVTGGLGGQVKVLETVALGNRCFVHLVQAGKGQVLAGTDSAGLKALVPLPSPFEDVLDDRLVRPPENGTPAVPDGLLAP